jgi:PAS domain-containing protein
VRKRALFERVKVQLDAVKPVRAMKLTPEELRDVRELQLLTAKPVMYVANVDEKGFQNNPLMRLTVGLTLVLLLGFWLTNFGMYFANMSLRPATVVAYYNGSEADFRPPRSAESMLETSHMHLPMMGMVLLFLTHLAIFVPLPKAAKTALIVTTFGSAVLEEGAGWLVRYVSPAFESILGYPASEAVGMFGPDIIHPTDVDGLRSAIAQDKPAAYPVRPIRLIIAATPGAGGDAIARLASQMLTDSWGQNAIVDARVGGSGAIAVELVARSAPDGYTLLSLGDTLMLLGATKRVPFDVLKAFDPVVPTSTQPYILLANLNMPFRSIKELVAYSATQTVTYSGSAALVRRAAVISGETRCPL